MGSDVFNGMHRAAQVMPDKRKKMGKHETYVSRTEAFLESLQESMEFEIVDVEFVREGGNWFLRIYCDKQGGIGVDDCADISRRVSDWLDEEDFISESYTLEVSSPGLGRELKKEKDFIRECGRKVDVKTFRPIEKRKEFSGILKAADSSTVTIEEDGKNILFEKKNIAQIRLSIDF